MRTLTLEIEGMHCTGCARALERALSRVPGVRTARVSYEDEVARLLIDPDLASPESLTAVVEDAGYVVRREGR